MTWPWQRFRNSKEISLVTKRRCKIHNYFVDERFLNLRYLTEGLITEWISNLPLWMYLFAE